MEKQIRKLILTRGIQGSGKTFFARNWCNENPENRVRINRDDIRNMLGKYWVPEREGLVTDIENQTLWSAMRSGYDIVNDNMNLNPKTIANIQRIINDFNEGEFGFKYEIEFKDFFTPLEECIRRDATRPNPIGEKVIRETWRKYKHFIQTTSVEKYVNNLIPDDPNKPYCVVIDMDSTMCFNMSKRPWYGEGSTEAMINDVPNEGVVKIIETLDNQGIPIVVCTGRNESQYSVTKQWLEKYNIDVEEFYMRPDNDFRPGVEIKASQITKLLTRYNILAIFEDCEPIVERFREMGLTVLQPNKGL